MRVGLLGAGRIGSLHAGVLAEVAAVERLVIFDPVAGRAGALAGEHEAEVAGSVAEVMARSDAVVIASSTDSHAEYVIEAARARLPAFCEKPIAVDLGVTDRAIAVVEETGVPVQMGFNRRFDAGYLAARQAVADGTIGTLMLVVGHHHDHTPPPEEYLPVSGGQFKDQLIHDFDLVRFVTGDEVVRVHAAGSSVGWEVAGRHDDTSVTTVTLWLRSGAMAMLCGARMDPIGYDVRMEVFGTGDSLAVGLDEQTPLRSVEPGQTAPRDPYREWLPRFGGCFRAEMEAFVAMAAGDRPSPCTVHDARAALAIAEACGRSLLAGIPIEMEDVT
jgi:myo-inositol 2-dehydrogenase/D-chiro-inositol 1-dehydrogenase